jgi:dGTP triphosphohydrolase
MIRKISLKYLLSVVALTLLVTVPNQPQSLDDWKAAQGKEGCESIPYSSYRQQCKENSDDVERYCKSEPWSCDKLPTKALRENMAGVAGYISRLKEEKDRLDSQKSNAGSDEEKSDLEKRIREVQDKIDEKTKTLKEMQDNLDDNLREIENRLNIGNQCKKARDNVQQVFSKAADDADRETDQDIKAIASQLITYWKQEAAEHKQAMDNTDRGIDKCNRYKAGES